MMKRRITKAEIEKDKRDLETQKFRKQLADYFGVVLSRHEGDRHDA